MRQFAQAFVTMLVVSACTGAAGASPPLTQPPTMAATSTPQTAPTIAPTASAPSSLAGDAATAFDLASRFETARAAGRWSDAWALLSDSAQRTIGSVADFGATESAYNEAGGTVFEIQEPTNDLEAVSMAVGPGLANEADLTRGFLVFIQHPNIRGASAGSEGLFVAPDRSGEWRIWIAH